MKRFNEVPAARAAGTVLRLLLLLPALLLSIACPCANALADGKLRPLKTTDSAPLSFDLRAERALEVKALTAPMYRAHREFTKAGVLDRSGRAEPVEILLLRLGYRTNRTPENNTIPADGGFMMDASDVPEYALTVDPPPHDTAYFDAHMRALREFYRIQSYGRFDMNWTIAEGPSPEDGAFLISDIADYGPADGESWTLELLETFVRAALDSIDAQLDELPGERIRFGDYDHILLFHAGSDYQNDVLRDSPHDLPSFNIFFGDPLGPHPVDGGETLLGSLILLPETTTQDADADHVLGAINAVVAHEFGHQLDLVDTYDTIYGWPCVGYWDLMDSGHQVLFGFAGAGQGGEDLFVYGALPSTFGIWHRMLLGWVNTADGSLLRPGGGSHAVELSASNLQNPGVKGVRVDLSDSEYFLLENRQELLHTGGRYLKQDPDTKVFQFMSFDFPEDPDLAVNSGEYDYFSEQSGLLAWHIDERGFPTLYDLNEINVYGDRHVRLVQADGLEELGEYGDWRGDEFDPFYTGHVTEWTDATVPNTRLMDGTPSGFSLTNLVTSPYIIGDGAGEDTQMDSTITFDIRLQGIPAAFPRDDSELMENTLSISPSAGTLLPLGDWLSYMMASLDADTLTQAHWIRSRSLALEDPEHAPALPPTRIDSLPLGAFQMPAPIGGDPYWGVVTADSLWLWQWPTELEPGPVPLPGTPLQLPGSLVAGPVGGVTEGTSWLTWAPADGGDPLILVVGSGRQDLTPVRLGDGAPGRGARDGAAKIRMTTVVIGGVQKILHAYADADTSYARIYDPLLVDDPVDLEMPRSGGDTYWVRVLDADGDDEDDILWIDDAGRAVLLAADGPETLFDAELGPGAVTAPPIPVDMDGNGYPEIILPAGSVVHRFTMEGHEPLNWPVRLVDLLWREDPLRVGSVLRASDMDGDNLSELIFFAQTGHLIILDGDGAPILGTPRSLAAAGPQDLYTPPGKVYAASREGFLLCFEGTATDRMIADWPLDSGGPTRDGRWVRRHMQTQIAAFPEEGGWFLYPNPAATAAKLYHGAAEPGTTAKITVYDIEGQLRFSKTGVCEAGGPWELPLDVTGLAPAIYLCRIEVESEGEIIRFNRRLGVLR